MLTSRFRNALVTLAGVGSSGALRCASGGFEPLAKAQPDGVPQANWLPVPSGPFDIMLRVYGPEGTVADGTYTPPAIVKP